MEVRSIVNLINEREVEDFTEMGREFQRRREDGRKELKKEAVRQKGI